MFKKFKNKYAEYVQKENIIYITYNKGIHIDLDAAIQIVKDRILFQEGKAYPIMCDIRGIIEVDKPGRDYLADQGSILILAVAFIVERPVSELMSKFYIKTAKPPISLALFEDFDEALQFLYSTMDS